PPRRRRQGWWLRCYCSERWQEEKEQEPKSRGTAFWRTSRCSSSAGGDAGCREIQKLAKRVSVRREQSSKDGSPPPRQRSGKEKASDSGAAAGEKELRYQSPARELKGVYHDDDSDSDNGDRRKK